MSALGKISFRKLIAVLATLGLSITCLSLSASPASAVTNSWYQGTHTFYVGVAVDLDLSCVASKPGEVVGNSPYFQAPLTLPAGLSFENDSHIRGIPTQVETIDLPQTIACYFDVNDGWHIWNFYIGAMTVLPKPTPPPYVTVTNLNDANCDIRVVGSLTSTPDSATTTLTIADANSSVTGVLADVAAGQLIDITLSAADVRTIANDTQKVLSITMGGWGLANFCGNSITATLSYQHLAGQAASMSASTLTSTPPVPDTTTPFISWSASGDSSCTVHMTAIWPSLNDGDTPRLYVATDTFGYDITLIGIQAHKVVNVDLPLMRPDAFANGEVAGIDHYQIWGDVPTCDGQFWIVNSGIGAQTLTRDYIRTQLPAAAPAACSPGTYSQTGKLPCADAHPGSFVSSSGATAEVPCGLGFYSDSSRAVACVPAQKGSFVALAGAIASAPCDVGKTTRLSGARSTFECYSLIKQSARGVRVLAVYKASLKITTGKTTDLGAPLDVTAVGACTVKSVTVTNKVKGKNVRFPRYQVALGKKGNCALTYSNVGSDTYAAFRLVKKIKITKTGK